MSKKDCLLIKTRNKRKLFTSKRNLKKLMEFAKLLGLKISIVKVENPKILDLKELAYSITQNE